MKMACQLFYTHISPSMNSSRFPTVSIYVEINQTTRMFFSISFDQYNPYKQSNLQSQTRKYEHGVGCFLPFASSKSFFIKTGPTCL